MPDDPRPSSASEAPAIAIPREAVPPVGMPFVTQPINFLVRQYDSPVGTAVLIRVASASGEIAAIVSPDQCEEIANVMLGVARQAKSGLVLPDSPFVAPVTPLVPPNGHKPPGSVDPRS